MYLIDADEFFKNLTEYAPPEMTWNAGDIAHKLDEMPRINTEPVRHGKWRHLGGDEWCCTVCGEVIYTEGSWEKPTHKYCHECGAKMDKGVQNDQN